MPTTAYADASFLVSLCLPDVHSAAAVAALKKYTRPLALTGLQKHELRNALRLAVFRTRNEPVPITAAEAAVALARCDALTAAGSLAETSLPWSAALATAERLGAEHTSKLGVRGMDLLNVAAAVSLGAKIFFTFDGRQSSVARAAGLQVRP